MDSIDYAIKLQKEFGVDQSEALKMLDIETDDRRSDPFHSRKPSYREALASAYDAISSWLRNGDEYTVRLDWKDLARFAASHRRACVWAVLICKSAKAEGKV